MWEIIETELFGNWFASIDLDAQEDIVVIAGILKEIGPKLGRPYVDTVEESKHKNMKELIVQSKGRPFRIFFAFDPKRTGVLLIGGDKTGKKRFYKEMIPKADKLYSKYLEDLKNEKV